MKTAVLLLFMPFLAWAGPDEDWAKIEALDRGPGQLSENSVQARAVVAAFLQKQEELLRAFLAGHREDARATDAKLRLAHLLAVKGDMQADQKLTAQAWSLLGELEKTAPPERRADVDFARISILMRTIDLREPGVEQKLLGQLQGFEKKYPQEKRLPALLVEVATLFDEQPRQKRKLLEKALAQCSSEALRQRITDDLKRLDLLGRPLELELELLEGGSFSVANQRGQVVVLCFFAEWSPPSLRALSRLKSAVESVGAIQVVGISLDPDKQALKARLEAMKINWHVSQQAAGWESPLVRSLGINALPTLWAVDKKGCVHVLRAQSNLEAALKQLVR